MKFDLQGMKTIGTFHHTEGCEELQNLWKEMERRNKIKKWFAPTDPEKWWKQESQSGTILGLS